MSADLQAEKHKEDLQRIRGGSISNSSSVVVSVCALYLAILVYFGARSFPSIVKAVLICDHHLPL